MPHPNATAPLPPPQADGVKALLAADRARILESCTRCGKCFEACPMVGHVADLHGLDGAQVVTELHALLREQPGSPAALRWTMSCTKSGVCDAVCPAPISPRMMLRLARISALGGTGHAPQVQVKEDPDYFAKVHAFARLQLSDDERAAWTVAPRRSASGAAGGERP